MKKTVGILSYEQHNNATKDSIGSSRIRVKWPLKHWPDAEEFKIGVKYDAIIFQKAYFMPYMRAYQGIKILDLCDPDWMEGKEVVEAIELCDAVTVSSQGLYDYVSKFSKKPVYLIPDRVDLTDPLPQKFHTGRATRAVWFGYSHNQATIDPVLPMLKRLGMDLTVISNLPYMPSSAIDGIDTQWIVSHITNIKYDPETINEEIINGGDFVLNYRPNTGKYIYKSDNKTLIAWSLGMPVARSSEDVDRFMEPGAREEEAKIRTQEVKEHHDAKQSVVDYRHVISEAERSRHTQSVPSVP